MYEVKTEVIRSIKEEFINELNERGYEYSGYALDSIINEYLTRKQKLLELLSKHPLWNPDKLMIQFDQDYDRRIELKELVRFCGWLYRQVTTWNGDKSLEELNCTRAEDERRRKVINWINYNIKTQFFNESMKEQIDEINSFNENFKLRTNMKSSKAIGKICREEGWDKLDEYNTKYAALCDNLNPIKVKRHTVISLNPLDFLLMSNGDSWESCHYIGDDIDDAGCYSSGTISYMLDECSFVFYTVNADFNGADVELARKSQREIFGYNDEVFIQSRLYPQANDSGADAIYDDIRHIVQKIIADCLEKPNLWTVSKDLSNINDVVKKGENATCYPDWHKGCPGSNHVSLSTLKSRAMRPKSIVLGAQPICITCGNRHSYDENISCCENGYYCEDCGCSIDPDDVYWVGDYPYCSDCAIYCERCGYNERKEDAVLVDGEWYCEDCANQIASCCDYCDEYYRNEDGVHTEEGNFYCENCIEDNAFCCEKCGEWHDKDNGIEMEDGNWYCKDCIGDVAVECEECGEWVYKEDGYYDEVTDSLYCKECYNNLLAEREGSEEDENEAV